jgi:tetratricopeptide (TPR) repeat protein
LQLAAALRGLDRLDEAASIYRRFLQLDDEDAESHSGLASIARARGDIATAILHFQRAANLNSAEFGRQTALANILVIAGQLEDAKAIYHRVSAQAPKHFAIRAALGDLAGALEDFAGALEQFRVALESDPGNRSVRIKLGRTLGSLDRWPEAEEVFRTILNESPGDVDATKGLAFAAKARNDLSTALALFETAATLAPFDINTKTEIRNLRVASESFDWRAEIDDAIAVARSSRAPLIERIRAAEILLRTGVTEVAGPILSQLQDRSPEARRLLMAMRQMERMGFVKPQVTETASADVADHQVDQLHGFVEKLVPGVDTLLIAFGGTDHRIYVTFSLLHRILGKAGASVVYVRDLKQNAYKSGIVGLGDDIESATEGFRAIAKRCGARRILTLGHCVGCAGALRYALALGAESVLGLHPRILPDEISGQSQRALKAAIGIRQVRDQKTVLDAYRDAAARPKVSLIFCEHSVRDASQANAFAAFTGVTPIPLPGLSTETTLLELILLDLLEPVLLDFVTTGAVSAATRARIAGSAKQ